MLALEFSSQLLFFVGQRGKMLAMLFWTHICVTFKFRGIIYIYIYIYVICFAGCMYTLSRIMDTWELDVFWVTLLKQAEKREEVNMN